MKGDRLYQTQQYSALLHQQEPSLPLPSTSGQIVPAATSDTTNTADSAPHSSGTESGLILFSLLVLLAEGPTQASPLPPALVPLAIPEPQEIHRSPTRVSISQWLWCVLSEQLWHPQRGERKRLPRIYGGSNWVR
jgi:hypothetical protein